METEIKKKKIAFPYFLVFFQEILKKKKKEEEEEEKKGSELPKRDNKDALLKSEEIWERNVTWRKEKFRLSDILAFSRKIYEEETRKKTQKNVPPTRPSSWKKKFSIRPSLAGESSSPLTELCNIEREREIESERERERRAVVLRVLVKKFK